MAEHTTPDDLIVDREEGIVTVTLNRPQRLNALSLELVDGLTRVLRALDPEHDRVVVLTGGGRAFCAGIDLKLGVGERTDSALRDMVARYDLQHHFADLVATMRSVPQPLIGAIHGPAVGGGLSLAAACDIRIADTTALFNVAFLRVGLTGGDMGTSYFLPKSISTSMAAELLYTGRDFGAREALDLGFVSRVVDPGADVATAREIATQISRNSPIGVRLTKEGLNIVLGGADLGTALALENRAQVMCMFTELFEQSIERFRRRSNG